MSAIWGLIDFCDGPDFSICGPLENFYHCYRIDCYERLTASNALFGCCHQYLTKEAASEQLPFHDKERQLLYTADCVLDNREELLSQLPECPETAPDGQLLLAAYLKWGGSFSEHVLGAFAFAVYHTDTGTAELFTDHMGNRSLFYSFQNGRLLFSTAIVPLAKSTGAAFCEQWLSGCLFSTSADMMLFPRLTPYENIFQLPAACMLTVTASSCRQSIYWSPLKLRPNLYQPVQEAYAAMFVNTLSQSVSSMLRSPDKTGCTLSSGLDSSSVAALAASALSLSHKSLYSYTSVPLPDFAEKGGLGEIVDETPGVRLLCAGYPNIIPHFLPCRGRDAFSQLPDLLPLIGYPMKSGHNLTWLSEIYRQASVEGCRLMLKGQYGNATISYGPALGTIYQLLLGLHPRKAFKAAKTFGSRYGVPRKKLAGLMLKEWKHKLFPPSYDAADSLTAPELVRKYRLQAAANKILKQGGGGQMDSRRQHLNFIMNPLAQMQLGMFDTIMGLTYGILIRDPSKDKRVVELCCRLPIECMLAGGAERGMVRTYMKGLVPEQLLNDLHHRGVQSADYCYRSRLLWHNHKEKVLAALSLPALQGYTDSEALGRLTERLKTLSAEELTEEDLRQANVLYSCSLCLQLFS